MGNSLQAPLFHEDVYEALRTVIMALGGCKKMGSMLWPEKSPQHGAELLNNCLSTARQEKLDPEQLLFLLVEGQKVGCHALADYMGQCAGYKFLVIEPEDEKAELQKQVIDAAHRFGALVKRLEKISI